MFFYEDNDEEKIPPMKSFRMDYDLENNHNEGEISRDLNAINEDSRESGYSSKSGLSSMHSGNRII